ncbi:hypothetical protein D8674_010471 [Pyrus ussuriensis x Pyrus communis]|uniref:Uncharacterized protein n=1 Tax=Pyrus ussuriensis x Pyrus communis TaxID=2448454 RepID=A0A5N5FG63_9ROSA|nr:hypothetical protein D8674_010471 [Pyrus ussuriensis x Pyrus communis]
MNTWLSEMVMAGLTPHRPPSLVPPSTPMSSMFLYGSSCFAMPCSLDHARKIEENTGVGNDIPYLASPMEKVIVCGFLQKEKRAKVME